MRLALVLVLVLAREAAADDSDHARVELVDKGGAPHAIITTKVACPRCPEWTLDLGRADAVALVALVDLRGSPTRVRGSTPAMTLDLAASATQPAAFVRISQTDAENTRWERWAVVELDGKPAVIWRGEIAMTTAKGTGFATTDGVELVATDAGKPLALDFVQTPVPATKRPGVHRHFVIKDGAYQHE
ncbi:MAG TPA: hypothetical protein VGG28_14435 [Kofleriaceae bacterium]|jgi:hypothetical protein